MWWKKWDNEKISWNSFREIWKLKYCNLCQNIHSMLSQLEWSKVSTIFGIYKRNNMKMLLLQNLLLKQKTFAHTANNQIEKMKKPSSKTKNSNLLLQKYKNLDNLQCMCSPSLLRSRFLIRFGLRGNINVWKIWKIQNPAKILKK